MKKLLTATFSALILAGAASSALAGERTVVSKQVVEAPPVYGTGWYFGLQAGINAAQDYGDDREFSILGNDVRIETNDKVGFAGGIKLGYVFGTGTVRPAIEADLYYNGIEVDVDARVNDNDTDFNADAKLHSGAFMGNFLLRFAFDRFQPYVGGGVGGYYAESQDAEITIAGRTRHIDGGSNSGFAWQLVGGADYYFTEKVSAFFEYKFLNYEDAGFSEDRIGQHLIVLGLRLHF
jgi:opacity protein-like surface antigen